MARFSPISISLTLALALLAGSCVGDGNPSCETFVAQSDVSLTTAEFEEYLDADGELTDERCADLCFDHSSDPADSWDECTDQGVSGGEQQIHCTGTEMLCSVD